MLSEVLPLRHASRELVRELGFLQGRDASTSLSHSHIHTLIEIERRGILPQAELPSLLRLDKSTTSRIVAELVARRWLKVRSSDEDARARLLALTPAGRAKVNVVHREANARVEQALAVLGENERSVVVRGMELYARALERSRRQAAYAIRPIEARDRAAVARLIRTVMPEFGAKGPGYAINDPEVDDMFAAYRGKRSAYFVVVRGGVGAGEVVGGAGYAPLAGGDRATCELRKMYFMPEVRGLGLGQRLLADCLAGAKSAGFRRMYLETLARMTAARALYERNGFRRLHHPAGNTGHFSCDAFYLKKLC
ncbi:MAG: bifunctional helix-turn-helix transcriptional regulator/GNAT family N-acetyltransferase [Labilithrix sp.]|nr:bifunctional helix-turn-helix transcriptional regulator/GNAT family N-acetyltransferase [Labilithrix sp.]